MSVPRAAVAALLALLFASTAAAPAVAADAGSDGADQLEAGGTRWETDLAAVGAADTAPLNASNNTTNDTGDTDVGDTVDSSGSLLSDDGTLSETTGTLDTSTDGLDSTLSGSTDGLLNASLDADATLEATAGISAGVGVAVGTARGTETPAGDGGAGSDGTGGASAPPGAGGAGSSNGPVVPPGTVVPVALGVGATALAARHLLQSTATTGGTWTQGQLRSVRRTVTRAWPGDGGWRERWWRVLGLLGYQRYDDSDPLAHDGRARIHRHVTESGGAALSEIADATDIPLSTARYHLRILEHEHLLTGTKLLGRRWYVPAGGGDGAVDLALGEDAVADVLESLALEGAGSVSDLADRLDRDPSTVTHHLQRLDEAGLVEREREGRAVVTRVAPAVRSALLDPDAGAEEARVPGAGRAHAGQP